MLKAFKDIIPGSIVRYLGCLCVRVRVLGLDKANSGKVVYDGILILTCEDPTYTCEDPQVFFQFNPPGGDSILVNNGWCVRDDTMLEVVSEPQRTRPL